MKILKDAPTRAPQSYPKIAKISKNHQNEPIFEPSLRAADHSYTSKMTMIFYQKPKKLVGLSNGAVSCYSCTIKRCDINLSSKTMGHLAQIRLLVTAIKKDQIHSALHSALQPSDYYLFFVAVAVRPSHANEFGPSAPWFLRIDLYHIF